MGEFTFRLEQEDADEFSLLIEDGQGCTWRVPSMRTADAVGLYKAVSAGIGDYVAEMERARRDYDARALVADMDATDPGFEGHGDFSSDDPVERWTAHQAAKGRL